MGITTTTYRWQAFVNMILGFWLFISPFAGFGAIYSVSAMDGYFFGAVIILLSMSSLLLSQIWEEWITMAIGIWLFAAPFVLGFSNMQAVTLNHIDVGVALFGSALWAASMYPRDNIRNEYISHEHHA